MTKETKIGLLVGLAFIILFAIILSEKGANRGASAPSGLSIADASAKAERSRGAQNPLASEGRLPVESTLAPPPEEESIGHDRTAPDADRGSREGPIGQPVPKDNEPIGALPESVVDRLNQPVSGDRRAGQEAGTHDEPRVSLDEAVAAALEQPPGAPAGETSEDPGVVSDTVAQDVPVASGRRSGQEASDAARPGSRQTSGGVLTVHLVRPGESLGKIAARYYGRASRDRIGAIFNANRDVLSDIDVVRADDRLKIPALGDEVPAAAPAEDPVFEPAPDFAGAGVVAQLQGGREARMRIPRPIGDQPPWRADARNSERSNRDLTSPTGRDRPRPSFTWYEVRHRDTLSKIAKRELGDEKRYLEIYRLNRDVIEDKNVIRAGLKIRLPLKDADPAAAKTTVVASSGGAGAGER